MNLAAERPLLALNRVLESIQSVRNGGALYVLLGSFSMAGLLLAMAQSALVKDATLWGVLQGGLALTVAFYGGNAAGLLVMDEARGRPPREVAQAVRDALAHAHRLLLVLLGCGLVGLALIGVLMALLWLCRLPTVGPLLFGLVVPLGVVMLGLTLLAAVAVVGPLAAPATWRGLGVRATWAFLRRQVRRRLLFAALLSAAASLLAAVVGALVSFAVIAGGRAVAALAVLVVHVDLPPQQLMGGLFGYGLRTLGAAGAPAAQNAYGVAALVGGGVVFALALVLPGVVYLRGMCSAYLALEEADALHGLPPALND
ncbi:hypothetical protein [Ideonella sp. BN130291]|uniref:hypothetical protein n=1 Tax=Ideonella sp. BN130291 TaxID=3112940 RepID=UPI002E265A0D|nr:hypothetical protein [Ideonella sp. BN130291]